MVLFLGLFSTVSSAPSIVIKSECDFDADCKYKYSGTGYVPWTVKQYIGVNYCHASEERVCGHWDAYFVSKGYNVKTK